MRKYVIGFLVGAALTVSVSAVADTTSFLGKRIGAETEVYLDGELFDTAAIVGGVSLAPLRKAYETAGYNVRFVDGKIYLTSKQPNQPTGGAGVVESRNILYIQKEFKEDLISELETTIANHGPIYVALGDPLPYEESEQYVKHQEELARLKSELADIEAEIEELMAAKVSWVL